MPSHSASRLCIIIKKEKTSAVPLPSCAHLPCPALSQCRPMHTELWEPSVVLEVEESVNMAAVWQELAPPVRVRPVQVQCSCTARVCGGLGKWT